MTCPVFGPSHKLTLRGPFSKSPSIRYFNVGLPHRNSTLNSSKLLEEPIAGDRESAGNCLPDAPLPTLPGYCLEMICFLAGTNLGEANSNVFPAFGASFS